MLLANRIKHLLIRFIQPNKILTATCRKYNLKFRFFIRDGVGRDIYYKYGVYSEDYITSFLLNNINISSNDLILDIGANLGWYSLVLSNKERPTVIAFEPDPLNYQILCDNIELNERYNITSINAAVAEKDGIMKLHLYKKHNLGRHSFIEHNNSTNSVDVPTIVIDNFLATKGFSQRKIKFLKIDIEGYEYTALRGAKQALTLTENALTEFSPSIMNSIKDHPKEFLDFMTSFGFSAFECLPSGIIPANFDKMLANPSGTYNILWRKL